MKRAPGTMTGTPPGIGASSSARTNGSSTIWPALTSGIDALPEWFDAGSFDGIDEQLVRPLAQLDIGGGDILNDIGHLRVRHGGTDQLAKPGVLVGLAAERDLIKLLTIFLDAENADVADMVMAAGVDAAGNVDVQPAEVAREVVVAETPGDFLRDRNRSRIREVAIIEARAGDNIGDEPDIRRRAADCVELTP